MLLAIAATAWRLGVKVNGAKLNGVTIGMDWFCSIVADGTYLRALERIWPQIPGTRDIQKKWVQDGLFNVHPSPNPDSIFSRFVAATSH